MDVQRATAPPGPPNALLRARRLAVSNGVHAPQVINADVRQRVATRPAAHFRQRKKDRCYRHIVIKEEVCTQESHILLAKHRLPSPHTPTLRTISAARKSARRAALRSRPRIRDAARQLATPATTQEVRPAGVASSLHHVTLLYICSPRTLTWELATSPPGGWFNFCWHCDDDLGEHSTRVHCLNGCPQDNNIEARKRVLKWRKAR